MKRIFKFELKLTLFPQRFFPGDKYYYHLRFQVRINIFEMRTATMLERNFEGQSSKMSTEAMIVTVIFL